MPCVQMLWLGALRADLQGRDRPAPGQRRGPVAQGLTHVAAQGGVMGPREDPVLRQSRAGRKTLSRKGLAPLDGSIWWGGHARNQGGGRGQGEHGI